MFERYSEKSRRVVFFAREEANNYRSRYVETEHLLLGLLREEPRLAKSFPIDRNAQVEVRAEIDKRTTGKEVVPPTLETPLSRECISILKLAAEACETLGQDLVEPDHLLIGIFHVETSLAAQILIALGLEPHLVEDQITKRLSQKQLGSSSALQTLRSFLVGLNSKNSAQLIDFFARNAEYIDASGKQWNREQILVGFDHLFGQYAKKNATFSIEQTVANTDQFFITTILWKNAILASEQRSWIRRMSVVLAPSAAVWKIVLIQVTIVQGRVADP